MQPTPKHLLLLVLSGLVAIGIGATILLAPAQFHATHGIELGTDANLLSEIRAPGGALMVLGLMMLVGAFRKPFTLASTAIAAAVYLAYGLSRLVSIGLDGVPDPGLIGAAGIELVIGTACALALARSPASAQASRPSINQPKEVS